MARPAITPANLTVGPVISRRRNAQLYAPEDRFLFWHHDFHTQNNYDDGVFSATGGATLAQGQHYATLSAGGGGTTATFLASRMAPAGQCTVITRVVSHNSVGTFNDIGVGLAVMASPTSNTISGWMLGKYRITAGSPNGYIELQYSTGGAPTLVSTTLSALLVPPFELIFIQNHNSIALAVIENGRERILKNFEVPLGTFDLEDVTTVSKLRPFVKWESDGAQLTTISDIWVRANGTLGDREHYPATYENGEPITDGQNNIYVTADATGPTTLTVGSPLSNSEWMRNQSTTRLYNPVTGVLGANTAKYVVKVGDRIFGAQQGKVMFDRGASMFDRGVGKFHWYSSIWNTTGRNYMVHYETYENILNGYHIFDNPETVDVSGLGPRFTTADYYDTDVRRWGSRWYLCGTVTGTSPISAAFCASGPTPKLFDKLHFISNTHNEGTRFWDVGNSLYVATGLVGGVENIFDAETGLLVKTLTLPASNRYKHQASLIPYVSKGKTQYQVITFSDVESGLPGFGEDYYADFNAQTQSLAFGPTLIVDLGTYLGEQFPPNPIGGTTDKSFPLSTGISI